MIKRAVDQVDFDKEYARTKFGSAEDRTDDTAEFSVCRLPIITTSSSDEMTLQKILKQFNPALQQFGLQIKLGFRVQASIFKAHYADNWHCAA